MTRRDFETDAPPVARTLEAFVEETMPAYLHSLVELRDYEALCERVEAGALAPGAPQRATRFFAVLDLALDAEPEAQSALALCMAEARRDGTALLDEALEWGILENVEDEILAALTDAGADATRPGKASAEEGPSVLKQATPLALALHCKLVGGSDERLVQRLVRALLPVPLQEVPAAGGSSKRGMNLLEWGRLRSEYSPLTQANCLTFLEACFDLESPAVRRAFAYSLGQRLVSRRGTTATGRDGMLLPQIAMLAAGADLSRHEVREAENVEWRGFSGRGTWHMLRGTLLHLLARELGAASARAVANVVRQRPEWLEKGAQLQGDPLATPADRDLVAKLQAGCGTPLAVAAAHGNVEVVKALLAAGADPSANDGFAASVCRDREIRDLLRATVARQAAKRAMGGSTGPEHPA